MEDQAGGGAAVPALRPGCDLAGTVCGDRAGNRGYCDGLGCQRGGGVHLQVRLPVRRQ